MGHAVRRRLLLGAGLRSARRRRAVANLLAGALEGAVLVGGLSALGAGLVGLGLTKEEAIKYERDLKADRYLLFVHGTEAEADAARALLKPLAAVA